MSREIEHPTEVPGSRRDEKRFTHPAFAQIGASRCTGAKNLYGSDFEHHNFVTIHISRSELHRSLSRDWAGAHDEIIEVALSEAQWATFVSTLNSGSGVQCTLQHLERRSVPQLPSPPPLQDQFQRELVATLEEAQRQAAILAKLIEAGGKKSEMRDAIIQLQNHLVPNVSFVAKQFGEHMEDVTEKAKIEVSAYVESAVHRAGLRALDSPLLRLPKKEEK